MASGKDDEYRTGSNRLKPTSGLKKSDPTSRAILLSKRANAFLIERARVMQKDGRLLFLTQRGEEIEQFFNIPYKNTAFLLLGLGTSITESAVRLLAESGVMVGFVGTGGSPLLSAVDPVFMTPQSEYRPTEYMQDWMRMWLEEPRRLAMGRQFMAVRSKWVQTAWKKNPVLSSLSASIDDADTQKFELAVQRAQTTDEMLSAEAVWSRMLYARLRSAFEANGFKRESGKRGKGSPEERINSFLDHGNYIAYGYAAVAIYALGISFALPVLHGKTRRGALVFDVADLFKDAIVMPLAFEMGSGNATDQEFRNELIDQCLQAEVIDTLIENIKSCIIENIHKNQIVTEK
ncbi:type I-F CRISPR-associated endonuclease Cas1f [Glaciimonas sp. PAMC28666]|uniref:type I-F CRISPR-associated endonuclease Cas1f n=1 Tax=Glaciimonas sp. PAMC28666 TaxID=2807626 RepID=UPI0019654841|nr:type I-F CRISPR-associated endonuclease Cas1f [Glaciimonas sp. PAMC28666]QRX80825.1 type I-F CRISPR-associated endonuclease Cas1 [Glaciimonas sp. PAMC28666]